MTKKQEQTQSVLGLTPLAQLNNGSLVQYSSAGYTSTALTRTEERIEAETHKQLFVMAHQTRKTLYGANRIAQIRQSGADAFYETAEHLAALDRAVQGSAIQPYVEEFNHRNTQLAAQDLFAAMQAGVGRVIEQVNGPLNLKDEVERKPNGLQRLLGG